MDGLNIAGPLRIIIERSAQLPNTGRQDPSRHRRLGPPHREQVGLARQLPALAGELPQHGHSLGREGPPRASAKSGREFVFAVYINNVPMAHTEAHQQ
jgi:hypothetical protein